MAVYYLCPLPFQVVGNHHQGKERQESREIEDIGLFSFPCNQFTQVCCCTNLDISMGNGVMVLWLSGSVLVKGDDDLFSRSLSVSLWFLNSFL